MELCALEEFSPKLIEVSSWLIVRVLADGRLELLDALSHANDLLFDSGLLSLEIADLLLETSALSAHLSIVASNILVNSMQFIFEGLSSVLALHSQHILESFLLRSENLYFFLVGVQLFVKGSAQLHQVVKFAFEVSSVVATGLGTIILACKTNSLY